MKNNSLIVLSLFTTLSQAGFAENQKANNYYQPSYDPCHIEKRIDCECCTEKCVDCECYTPAYHDLQLDWGTFITVDFLYWYARETNLSYALTLQAKKSVDPTDVLALPKEYEHLDTRWDPGFRVGLGGNIGCDGWDIYAHWTYYHNKKSNSTSVESFDNLSPFAGGEAPLNSWVIWTAMENFPVFFDRVSAKWKLNFNSIDLEIGRKYWLSKCFTLRPFAGLRGAWTRTWFRTKSSYTGGFTDSTDKFERFVKDQFKNRFWGIGFFGGMQPNWHFTRNFILFANFDVALIWGEFEDTKKEKYLEAFLPIDGTIVKARDFKNKSESEFFMMQAILDLGLGLRWEKNWCCNRYRTALDLGWEHHIWFDHNHRNKVGQPIIQGLPGDLSVFAFQSYAEATGDLSLGGLVARLRLDF